MIDAIISSLNTVSRLDVFTNRLPMQSPFPYNRRPDFEAVKEDDGGANFRNNSGCGNGNDDDVVESAGS